MRHGEKAGDGDACECEVSFNGSRLGDPDWSWESRSLAAHYVETCEGRRRDFYLLANAWWEPLAFDLPALDGGRRWRLKIDTMADSPADIFAAGREPEAPDQKQILTGSRSIILLAAE